MHVRFAGDGIKPLGPKYLANLIIFGNISLVAIHASNSSDPSII